MSLTIINREPEPTTIGMGELPKNGRRYVRIRKRWSDGRVTEELREVPETNEPYFWIPSLGTVSKEEMEYLALAHKERAPSPEKQEFLARKKEQKATLNQRWRDLCDARGEEQKGMKRFALPDRSLR